MQNVEVVAEAEAAAALARSVGADAALLLADDDTVSLTVVGEDEESTSVLASVPIGAAGAAVACAAVLQQVPGRRSTGSCWSGSAWTLIRLRPSCVRRRRWRCRRTRATRSRGVPRRPVEGSEFPAGAATQMAPAARCHADGTGGGRCHADGTRGRRRDADGAGSRRCDADGAGDADSAAVGPLLAYSQEDEPDYYEMPADSIEEFVPEQEDEAPYTAVIAPPPPKTC